MEEQIKTAIERHEDYQRLQQVFSLDFLIDCFTNPRRGNTGTARWVGGLLRDYGKSPTLFVSGVHYHELVEAEEFKKMGYADQQLGDNKSNDPNYNFADTIAKRKELEFYQ
jgi:hypothetical protein